MTGCHSSKWLSRITYNEKMKKDKERTRMKKKFQENAYNTRCSLESSASSQ